MFQCSAWQDSSMLYSSRNHWLQNIIITYLWNFRVSVTLVCKHLHMLFQFSGIRPKQRGLHNIVWVFAFLEIVQKLYKPRFSCLCSIEWFIECASFYYECSYYAPSFWMNECLVFSSPDLRKWNTSVCCVVGVPYWFTRVSRKRVCWNFQCFGKRCFFCL